MMYTWKKCFISGLIIVIILYLPLILLGKDTLIYIHDQLDGEVLSYILQAKHFGEKEIPEFFGGATKASIVIPVPGMLILYGLLGGGTAFLLNYFIVAVAAYLGMFLCLKELLNKPWISLCTAIIFSVLPFYSVYGLSVMGQPLLLYASILLWKNKKEKISYIIIFLFPFCSSLVLAGYADVIIWMLFCVYAWVSKHKNKWKFLGGFIILLVEYLILNYDLVSQMLFSQGGDFVSHRGEWVIKADPFFTKFWELLEIGHSHAASYHKFILVVSVAVIFFVLCVFKSLKDEEQRKFRQMLMFYVCILFIAFFYAFWRFKPVVDLRNSLGGLFVSFQVDRFYWLNPCLWYIIFGYTLYFLYLLCSNGKIRFSKYVVTFLVIAMAAGYVGHYSMLKKNIIKLFQRSYQTQGYASWEDFFSPELFAEIKEYIGRPVNDYLVGSVGLYPSIPLYNGFYCIDGYSNNYDLKHKLDFRKIIEPELNKNEELKVYFDDWGSRCYFFSNEIPFEYYINKNRGVVLRNFQVNTQALTEKGCEYLISSVEILNNNSLKLEKVFENKDSVYKIFLYKIF